MMMHREYGKFNLLIFAFQTIFSIQCYAYKHSHMNRDTHRMHFNQIAKFCGLLNQHILGIGADFLEEPFCMFNVHILHSFQKN